MANDFYLGNLDISMPNYGVITLIPKLKEANNVRQFRSICLLNVSFKIFSKLLMDRLTDVLIDVAGKNVKCNVPPPRGQSHLHLAAYLGYRLPSQTNTSLFCTLCFHSCALGKNFSVGHQSPNFSGPSMLNLGVL